MLQQFQMYLLYPCKKIRVSGNKWGRFESFLREWISMNRIPPIQACTSKTRNQKYSHISSHNWNSCPCSLGITKSVCSLKRNLRTRLQSWSLGANQDILEVQLNICFKSWHPSQIFLQWVKPKICCKPNTFCLVKLRLYLFHSQFATIYSGGRGCVGAFFAQRNFFSTLLF